MPPGPHRRRGAGYSLFYAGIRIYYWF